MNLAYFDSTVNELTKLETDLSRYSEFINQAVAVRGLSCAELAQYALNASLKLAAASSQTAKLSTRATNDIGQMQTDISKALAKLEPLLVVPTDLPSAITWITAAVNLYAGPNATCIAQQAELTAQLARIGVAVEGCTQAIASISAAVNAVIAAQQTASGCIA